MPKLENVIDVMKLLDKSNCKECGLPACMAFAVAVIQGQKQLADCTKLDEKTIEEYGGQVKTRESLADQTQKAMEEMQKQITKIDLSAAAKRIGAPYADGKLTVHCLGKKFNIDTDGKITTDIHVNPWITGPVLQYVFSGGNAEPIGEWVPFRDLPTGKDWERFFNQRCEKPCKKVADEHPDFFNDLVDVFNGKQVDNHYQSDVSMVLHPLPRLPVLICYWKADGGLPSDLNIFFDKTAEDNLIIDAIYTIGVGMVLMFEKIAGHHMRGE